MATLPSSAQLADELDELLAPLLGELRDRQADHLAVVRRRQAEVGLLDRLLDRLDRGRVERLDRQQARLGRVDRRDVLERRRRAVVVDGDPVEQRGRGAARAHARELAARGLDRAVHPPFRIRQEVLDRGHHASSGSGVRDDRADALAVRDAPGCCPRRARTRGSGARLSMQRESAVVSITRRPRSIASRCVSAGRKRGSRVGPRVAVVDALDAVLRHQDRLGADLERPQRRGRVGREERVAGSRGEDHDPPLLEVAHRAAADVGLRDLGHRDRRLHARVRAEPLEGVLERERVEERREHAGVVGGRAVHPLRRRGHAAVDVPGRRRRWRARAPLPARSRSRARAPRSCRGRARTRARPSGPRPRA